MAMGWAYEHSKCIALGRVSTVDRRFRLQSNVSIAFLVGYNGISRLSYRPPLNLEHEHLNVSNKET